MCVWKSAMIFERTCASEGRISTARVVHIHRQWICGNVSRPRGVCPECPRQHGSQCTVRMLLSTIWSRFSTSPYFCFHKDNPKCTARPRRVDRETVCPYWQHLCCRATPALESTSHRPKFPIFPPQMKVSALELSAYPIRLPRPFPQHGRGRRGNNHHRLL